MESIDISNIQINKLSSRYNTKFHSKLNEKFVEQDEKVFISLFYNCLNYEKTDFVFDLDEIWKWMGFSNKLTSKLSLQKFFVIDLDYKSIIQDDNKEKFFLNRKTFKQLCVKCATTRSIITLDSFEMMEEILLEIIEEESRELKMLLREKQKEILVIREWYDAYNNQVLDKIEKLETFLLEKCFPTQDHPTPNRNSIIVLRPNSISTPNLYSVIAVKRIKVYDTLTEYKKPSFYHKFQFKSLRNIFK